jgi:hypothetical protein
VRRLPPPAVAYHAAMKDDTDPRPQPPEPPLPGECCDSGCDPCVLDTYAEELRYYREQLAKWFERHPEARDD